MQPEEKKMPWFLTPLAIAAAILCAGPLATPLVWMSGAFKRWQKWAITALIALFTIWLFKASVDLYNILLKDLQALQNVLK